MKKILLFILISFSFGHIFSQKDTTELILKKSIYGEISPKSIVYGGRGLFFAQNMMYRHTITVYNSDGDLVKTISDSVKNQKLGLSTDGFTQGAPVEASPSPSGLYMWVSNYQMYGDDFNNPGRDNCSMSNSYDKGYLYKINTNLLRVVKAVKVGCIPKYVATTPDNKYILTTNWCSGDLSIVDNRKSKEIKRIDLGRYPRGIVVSPDSKFAWATIMGERWIAKINLKTYEVDTLKVPGKGPRHLCIKDSIIYASLNRSKKVVKMNAYTGKIIKKRGTGKAPRSMVLSPDGNYLYVVNYFSNTMSKYRTRDMRRIQRVKTGVHPIGITYDPVHHNVWVACYRGVIKIFHEGPKRKKYKDWFVEEIKEPANKYHIITGCYNEKEHARHQVGKCNALGHSPLMFQYKQYKAVSVLQFQTKEEAELKLKEIQSQFEGAWILYH